jgi:glycosyltransferase involved in cell wall biosynthesis
MLGFCNQTVMPTAYTAADVLVLPSDGRETWGLVANEALACGRPIVLSDAVGSAPDLAGDGSAGRVFPVSNVGALAHAIGDLLDSPPSSAAIAAKSAAFSVERAAEGIVRAADFVADRRTRSNVSPP